MANPIFDNLSGVKFLKGIMVGTREGGTADAIAFGGLTNVEISVDQQFAEFEGDGKLQVQAVGMQKRRIPWTAAWGVLVAEVFVALLGGSAVFTTVTTYTLNVEDEPIPFDMKLSSPSDGSDMLVTLFRNLAHSFKILGTDQRTFNVANLSGVAYGQAPATGTKLITIAMPGNQTGSS